MTKRTSIAFILTVVLAAYGSVWALAATPARPDPGCAAGWTYTTSHSWWTEKGQPFPGRHIHLGACVPLHRTLTGSSVVISGDILLHGNPGRLDWVRASWGSTVVVRKDIKRSCATDCSIPFSLTVPFGGRSGWRELRLTANIGSNVFGDRQFQSTRYPMKLNGGGNQPSSGEGGRTGWAGWYHDKYQNVYVDEGTARLIEAGPITLPFQFQAKGDKGLIAAVDADSHASDPGLELGRTTSNAWRTYTIPAGLAPGWHALFLRTEQAFTDGVSAGQGEIWFQVR